MLEDDVIEHIEDPEQIEDPELQELMTRAEDLVAQAYTQEEGDVEEGYLEQAEEVLETYEWVSGLEKEGAEYEF